MHIGMAGSLFQALPCNAFFRLSCFQSLAQAHNLFRRLGLISTTLAFCRPSFTTSAMRVSITWSCSGPFLRRTFTRQYALLSNSSLAWIYAFSVALVCFTQPKLSDATHLYLVTPLIAFFPGFFFAIAGFFVLKLAEAGLFQACFVKASAAMWPELLDEMVFTLATLLTLLSCPGLAGLAMMIAFFLAGSTLPSSGSAAAAADSRGCISFCGVLRLSLFAGFKPSSGSFPCYFSKPFKTCRMATSVFSPFFIFFFFLCSHCL